MSKKDLDFDVWRVVDRIRFKDRPKDRPIRWSIMNKAETSADAYQNTVFSSLGLKEAWIIKGKPFIYHSDYLDDLGMRAINAHIIILEP